MSLCRDVGYTLRVNVGLFFYTSNMRIQSDSFNTNFAVEKFTAVRQKFWQLPAISPTFLIHATAGELDAFMHPISQKVF